MKTDLLTKILLALIAALLAACGTIGTLVGWYIIQLREDVQQVTTLQVEVVNLKGEVVLLGKLVESQAGGNPYDNEDAGEKETEP